MDPAQPTIWYKDAVALSSVIIAIATLAYVFVSLLLWKATKRAADITQKMFEAANRPYVGVTTIELETGPQAVHIPITVKNSGTVIASNIGIAANSFHNGTPFRADPIEEYPGVLIPGAEFFKDIVIRPTSFANIVAQGEEITVSVDIEYTGLTSTKYKSEAVFAFEPEISAFTGRGRKESILKDA